jgi:ATP-dependent DNA helicase RecG
MNPSELNSLLHSLISRWENETVEFKNVGDSYSTSDIGKYFSALANEANLRGNDRAWLVFGVDNKSRKVVSSEYRKEPERLHSLKHQIAEGTEPSITFREIHELTHENGRVILFEIPAAPKGIPIAWKGHRYARAGESLVALGVDKEDEIRAQSLATDWSAGIAPGAGLRDLDPSAISAAREAFALKYANRFSAGEVAGWPDATFLDRAKITINGAITRTALLLLGRTEATHHLLPHPVQITWKLEGEERAYEHFSAPFFLNTGAVYRKIRNIQMRILPEDQLLSIEVAKYDQKIILEALHNCIAHQDYRRNARILLTELPDRLLFENSGGFFEGIPQDYVAGTKTPRSYRNPYLVQAMVELNMIDTMGYGIHGMFEGQAKRFFPLPDYDLSDPGAVNMTLYGKIVDPAYSRLLIQKTGLSLPDIQALDRIQKHLSVDEDVIMRLRKAKLIEGRKPNFHISAKVADATDVRADYIRTRKQDDAFYIKLTGDYIRQYSAATREDIDKLLMPKLSEILTDDQKRNKIHNLLGKMKRDGIIRNQGGRGISSSYVLINQGNKSKGTDDLSNNASG